MLFIYQISGLVIVFFAFWAIRKALAPNNSFKEFFKGEDGKYSLSRLQATAWAYVIIAYQVSTFIAVAAINRIHEFSLVFSEEAIWLLGLSLGSYVTVKGITITQQTQTPPPAVVNALKRDTQASLRDFVCSDEGLDLSRFQMLIWTLFAIITFTVSYFNYIDKIVEAAASPSIANFFPPFSDQDDKTGNTILPTVDMSFIILMGLSHGAYIGRKLVPSYKVESFTREYIADMKLRKDTMQTGLKFKEIELQLIKDSPQVSTDKKIEMENEVLRIRSQMDKLQQEIVAYEVG
ncbi:hypothetical protein KK083_09035 [Fulvivirgaceae bacterium PWU4]|uniref:Uncharacterized protein n=1 Tax=Chryseosolibacter histidini TaxID=2782349 RepID=A0AAP2DIM1_9BACT|nr:hypothetical protein [Chryseosolibacter histidini]MBT1697016.1 hypothetical protein [Chryseosolibacter histidini]